MTRESLPRQRITIYLDGRHSPHGGSWIARAYDDDTDEHIWSSEGASSPSQALREVADGIERRAISHAS